MRAKFRHASQRRHLGPFLEGIPWHCTRHRWQRSPIQHETAAQWMWPNTEQKKGHLSSADKASKIGKLSQSCRRERTGGSSRGTSSKDRWPDILPTLSIRRQLQVPKGWISTTGGKSYSNSWSRIVSLDPLLIPPLALLSLVIIPDSSAVLSSVSLPGLCGSQRLRDLGEPFQSLSRCRSSLLHLSRTPVTRPDDLSPISSFSREETEVLRGWAALWS